MTSANTAVGANPIAQLRQFARDILHWFDLHGGEVLIALSMGVLIYLVLRLARRTIRRAAERHGDVAGVGAIALRTLARTGHFFLVMASARLVIGYANPPQVIDQTIRFLFIVAVAMQAAIWAREVTMGVIRERAQQGSSETLGNALSLINVLVSIALFSIAAIVVLDNLGVNVTGLIAGLGIGGIAIGLAAKGVFEDLFAAIAIIFDRPFRKGESIRYDQTEGTVERIGMKSTRLRAITGEEVVISNTNLLAKNIANFARLERRRMALPFGVSHQTSRENLARLPGMMRTIVERHDCRLVRCGLTTIAPSSFDFDLQFDVPGRDAAAAFIARHSIALDIIASFEKAGIAFAVPTQVSYTAAPDGALVMPWPPEAGAITVR